MGRITKREKEIKMPILYTVFYTLLAVVIFIDIFLAIKFFEYVYCANIRHQPPMVASNATLRRTVINEIRTHYPHAKTICEIGSGFGGLARTVARHTHAQVFALENMPFSVLVSKTADLVSLCKNNKTIWCDAFEYLDTTDKKFDIAIAFLGPTLTPKLKKYKKKIRVLISLDFAIPTLSPKRIIEIGHGYVIYKKVKYPHRLFVYEF